LARYSTSRAGAFATAIAISSECGGNTVRLH
jgi:hypothetical protein